MKNTNRRRVPGMPLINGRKETDHHHHHHHDQDLILFQELHKREKERNIVSLLQPVSDEFEPNGNYQLYRISSAKKGSGFEYLGENEKNDYDWLKTPPATPLFPSLEMDASDPELIIQRKIPILQPLSRFSVANCKSEAVVEHSNGRPKSTNSKSKFPLRSVTPSTQSPRSSTILNSSNQTKNTKAASTEVRIQNQQKKSAADHNDMMILTRKTKPTTSTSRTGAISPLPLARSIPAGFSNEKPPNLRTDERSISTTRDRSARAKSTARSHQQIRSAGTTQSCSSIVSVSRGRNKINDVSVQQDSVNEGNWINTSSPKGITGNGTQVLGSRMVQRVMSARSKAATLEENDKKPNSRFPLKETSGFGRMIPKNSMDIASSQTYDSIIRRVIPGSGENTLTGDPNHHRRQR